MAVESATYINQLNETLPTNTDSISEGDNHLRLIKQVLKNTFPNVGGAVSLTDADLNNAAIRASTLTNGALVKADASGKLVSSYAEADVPRRNQAETITGRWTFDTGTIIIRDQGSTNGVLIEAVQDDQNITALRVRNATFGGTGLSVIQYDTGDVRVSLVDASGNVILTLDLKQDGSAVFSGRLDASTIYENNLRVLASMNSGRLIGRTSSGAGQWEEISTGNGISLSAGVLDAVSRFIESVNSYTSPSRALGTVYQNTTGRTMLVVVSGLGDSGKTPTDTTAYIGSTNPPSIEVVRTPSSFHYNSSITFIVPPGWYYKVGSGNFSRWTEYS